MASKSLGEKAGHRKTFPPVKPFGAKLKAMSPLSKEEIEELKRAGATHYWPPRAPAGDMSDETGVTLITRGEGIWVEDAQGNRYIDILAGLWVANVGHGRRSVADALHKQALSIGYTPAHSVAPPTIRLAEKLASKAPDKRSRVFFASGGSEGVETAVKMARKYHANRGEPTRYKVISRRGSLHGGTIGCFSLGSLRGPGAGAPIDYGPIPPGGVTIQGCNPLRCGFCVEQKACTAECARELRRVVEHEGPSTVAAFIGEPISVTSGWHIPPPDYWREVRSICDDFGILLIADEILTGAGRTGKFLAMEHWSIAPDITVMGKGLSGGYCPIAAVIASSAVSDAFIGSEEKAFDHIFTFSGNPMATAAALAVLEIIEAEDLVTRSAEMGKHLFEQLQHLKKHPIIGDIRGGLGLMSVLELVSDKKTRAGFPKSVNLGALVRSAMQKNGLYVRAARSLSLAPALCITRDEVDELVSRVDRVVAELSRQLF
jgi:adenosylmethionine-8-amino-7-oxononanoate aminotransferase